MCFAEGDCWVSTVEALVKQPSQQFYAFVTICAFVTIFLRVVQSTLKEAILEYPAWKHWGDRDSLLAARVQGKTKEQVCTLSLFVIDPLVLCAILRPS